MKKGHEDLALDHLDDLVPEEDPVPDRDVRDYLDLDQDQVFENTQNCSYNAHQNHGTENATGIETGEALVYHAGSEQGSLRVGVDRVGVIGVDSNHASSADSDWNHTHHWNRIGVVLDVVPDLVPALGNSGDTESGLVANCGEYYHHRWDHYHHWG